MFKTLKKAFQLLFPILFASTLNNKLTTMPRQAIGHFPNGRFQYRGKINGASRRKKTNRLHLSKKTRNKHR